MPTRRPLARARPSRRSVLRAVGIGLALPVVPPLFHQSSSIITDDPDLEVVALLLAECCDRPFNPFEANASAWLGFTRLLGGSAAVAILLNYLNVRPAFARSVNYAEAGGCEPNFENGEFDMRRNHLTSFSGVHRSPLDRDIAVLAAKTPDGDVAGHAALGSQVSGAQYMTLEGDELSVAAIASDLARSRLGVSGTELARTVPLSHRADALVEDRGQQVPIRVLTNYAGGEVFWDRRPMGQATAGRVVLRWRGHTDPRNLPMIGLVS